MAGVHSLLFSTLVMLAVGVGFNKAQLSMRCSPVEECQSFNTGLTCGFRPLTPAQMRQIEEKQALIQEIENIDGPIYEGSPEAARLGLTRENPVVDLTFEQQTFYQRCEEETLLTPSPNGTIPGGQTPPFQPQRRRKRQAVDNTCCLPAPLAVRILASVTTTGQAVQVIQPQDQSQFFEDIRFCPFTINCGTIQCGPVETAVPAEVILLNPPRIGRETIVINVCGGQSMP